MNPLRQRKPKSDECECSAEPTNKRDAPTRSNTANSFATTNQPSKIESLGPHAMPTGQTKVRVKCNCGFGHNLFIRGEGIPGLSWNKGVAMKNVKADEWEWVCERPFAKAQIKVLVDDRQYERGENHPIECGKQVVLSPQF